MVNYDPIAAYERQSPFIKLLYETFNKSVKGDLAKNYFSHYKHVTKWTCVSDYCFDVQKANNVITFSFFPYLVDNATLADTIKKLARSEIKRTKVVDKEFIQFLNEFPIVSFSFILENHEKLFFDKMDDFRSAAIDDLRKMIGTDIPNWDKARPHLSEYHKKIAKQAQEVMRFLDARKQMKLIKNLFLTTTIGSFLATQIANFTMAEKMAWFSDRDEINDIADHFSATLFQIQLTQHLIKEDLAFHYAPASSSSDEWFGALVKIPDYICGALADYDLTNDSTTHDKFTPILRDFLADNSTNIFVFRLRFEPGTGMSLSRLVFYKKEDTTV